jgi:hypothetical protein
MGDTSILGLLFEIAADPSKAEEALKRFEDTTGKSFSEAAKPPKIFNDALLTNRESVRLLSQELGLHLPRAVSGAVAQVLPDIGTLGTALLGVFAVEEVYKFGKAAVATIDELVNETKTLNGFWDSIIKEQEELLRHPPGIKEAQDAIRETNRHIIETENRIKEMQKRMAEAPPGALLLLIHLRRDLTALDKEQEKLNDRLQAQLEALNKLQADANREDEKQHEAAIKRLADGRTRILTEKEYQEMMM